MANFEHISIEKGMYEVDGKNLTDVLESLDPSENYSGTSLEGLDAFGRQLKRFDIKVSGSQSDCVEKFFQTSNSAALFPEYVSRAVKLGMEQSNIISNIVATTTKISGMDYRSIVSVPSDDDVFPRTEVKTSESLVKLHKRGRMLVASYEALRFQRLDLFTITLGQIGSYIRRAQLNDAIDVITNGDGNNNACDVINVGNKNVGITFADLLNLWTELSPYNLTTLLAPTDAIKMIIGIKEINNSNPLFESQVSGKIMIAPLGADLLHIQSMQVPKLIGLDKHCALEMVQATDDVYVDYDRLIDRQLERATIASIAGFSKIFKESSKALAY